MPILRDGQHVDVETQSQWRVSMQLVRRAVVCYDGSSANRTPRCGLKAARRGARSKVIQAPRKFFEKVRPILKRPPSGIARCANCSSQQSTLWRKGWSGQCDLCNR